MEPDLELALELADMAAEIAAPRFEDRRFSVTIKPDGTPVTDVDQAVEQALRQRIAERRPDHAVLGEEYGRTGDSEWRWYLDPIDGTSHFVAGDPLWMTLVALAHGDQVVAGVVSLPARRDRWWAARGAGAFHLGEPIHVSATARLPDAVVSDSWDEPLRRHSGHQPLTDIAARAARIRPHQGHGFLAVAAGDADIGIEHGGFVWDHAPFRVIVEEAGGRYSDLAGRDRLDTRNALVTNGLLHDEVLAVARAAGG